MNLTNLGNFPASEIFLVASGNQPLATGSIYPASGNDIGLDNGQLGIISADHDATHITYGTFLTATNDVAGSGPNDATEIKAIKIVQGTPVSNDISVVDAVNGAYSHAPFVSSQVIKAGSPILFSGSIVTSPLRSAFVIGNVTSGTDRIPAADSTEYKLHIALESRRGDKWMSSQNSDQVTSAVTTPVFSSISLSTTAQKTDYVIQHLVYQANLQSKACYYGANTYTANKPFIAFAIDLDGGGTGTAMSAITAGTPFNFMVRNGQTYSYTPDATFVATIAALVANSSIITNSTEIGVVNLTTAGAQNHDAILIIALDEQKAVVEDRDRSTKVRLRIGMNENLYGASRTTRLEEAVFMFEGTGQSRALDIIFKERAKLQNWSRQWEGHTLLFLDSPNYVDTTKTYNVYTIEHRDDFLVNHSHVEQRPHRLHILIPANASGVGEATTVAGLNAVLAPWLRSVKNLERAIIPAGVTAPDMFA